MSEEVKAPEPVVAAPVEPVKPAEPKVEAPAVVDPKVEKPAEPKAVAPEKYDLKLSEGSLVDARFMERIATHAKEQGLSNEQAQALLDQKSNEVAAYIQEQSAAWKEAALADKEIGGDNLNKNVEMAKRVVDRFGSDSLKKELDKTGYGNHPEVVRLLMKIGSSMSEDQLVVPGSQPVTAPKSREELYYGKA